MTTTKTRKPAAKAPAASLSVDFAAQILRERTEWAWLFGIGPAREATEEERAAYEERLNDPAFAALHALAESARAGEDVSLLPVTVLDGGAAPEPGAPARTALEDAADPYERYYRPAADVPFLPSVMPGAEEAAAAHMAALPAFAPVLPGPERGPDETSVIPVGESMTETFEMPEGDGAS